MPDTFIAPKDVADLLESSECSVYRLAMAGHLPASEPGRGVWRVRRDDVVDRHQVKLPTCVQGFDLGRSSFGQISTLHSPSAAGAERTGGTLESRQEQLKC